MIFLRKSRKNTSQLLFATWLLLGGFVVLATNNFVAKSENSLQNQEINNPFSEDLHVKSLSDSLYFVVAFHQKQQGFFKKGDLPPIGEYLVHKDFTLSNIISTKYYQKIISQTPIYTAQRAPPISSKFV